MTLKSINPVTEQVMKEFKEPSFTDVKKQIANSRTAFESWKKVPITERAKLMAKSGVVLRKNSKKYGKLITMEMGKPLKSAIAEVEKCAWVCDYYAENGEKFLADELVETDASKSYVSFEPMGVVMAIMPWNFPFWQLFRFAAPGLVAGNVGVLKHSSNVPQCALAIEEVFKEAGFPKNVFQTLLIGSKTASKILENGLVDAVTLTGSTNAGRIVASHAARNLKKSVLELGGSDPFIALADADVELACKIGVQARMLNGGQSCIAAKRFIVVESIAKEFEERLVDFMQYEKMGDPMDQEVKIGPLAKKEFVDDIDRQVQDAIKKGGKVLIGGKRPKGKGYFYPPTIITNTKKNMAVLTEETFGPVLPIIVVKDDKEAIEVANNSPFGLGASLWTRDLKKAERLAKEIQAGSVFINDFVRSDPRLPFGGIKDSGYGRELSYYGMKEFVNIKTIFIK